MQGSKFAMKLKVDLVHLGSGRYESIFEHHVVQRDLPARLATAIVIYLACPGFTAVGLFFFGN